MRSNSGRSGRLKAEAGRCRLDRCGSEGPRSCSRGTRFHTRVEFRIQASGSLVQSHQIGDRSVNAGLSTRRSRHQHDIETGHIDAVSQRPIRLAEKPLAAISMHGAAHPAARDDCPTRIFSAIRSEDQDHQSPAQRGALIVRCMEITSEAKAAIRGGGTTQPGAFSPLRVCG